MKRLILIRHGETDYTQEGRYCGREDIQLNRRGKEQARLLAKKFSAIKVDSVYSSDSCRAYMTAQIIFEDKNILKKKDLREIDFGRLSGLNYEEAERLYPSIIRDWSQCPLYISMPEGEAFRGFKNRVSRCYKDIVKENEGKSVVIVSHGGPMRIILLQLLGLGPERFWEISLDAAGICFVEFSKKAPKISMMEGARWPNLSL